MMKKIFCVLIALLMLIPYGTAYAELPSAVSSISTKYVMVYEANSGSVLFEKNGYTPTYPASTTKIMTAIITIETGKLDDEVTLGNVVETRGSIMGIHPGEKLKLRDLLYGMMLKSGNDAARAIAEYIAGTRPDFAVLMNEKAAELGMVNTHFVTPNGLDDEAHKTTAYDMALLTAYALKNKDFAKLVSTEVYNIASTNKCAEGYVIENTNRLIHTKDTDVKSYKYQYATGVKTGDTINAGRCLVASAEHNGLNLVCVLFGDYENLVPGEYRFESAAKIFDYCFANYKLVNAKDFNLATTKLSANVKNASPNDTEAGALALNVDLDNTWLCVTNEQAADITANCASYNIKTNIKDKDITAPVKKGDCVGTVDFMYLGNVVFSAKLLASRDVIGAADGNSGVLVSDDAKESAPNNAWLFWILAAALVLLIVIVIRSISMRKKTRHRRRGGFNSFRSAGKKRY